MIKRKPLTPAEIKERSIAGKASAMARHRAETSPSVNQGATTPPSRQAVGLFRQGQARPDTRANRGVWDTRAQEAPVGAMNASFTFHFPKAYRDEKPDTAALSPKSMARALAESKAKDHGHQDVVIKNPEALLEAHRHPRMREIAMNAINVVRDHQKGTIENGHARKLIPEGTRVGTVARAYKHAALRAMHKAGLGDYDTNMDEAAKAEFRPLVPFMRYAARRIFDHLNQGPLKGKWQPFRDEFGQIYRQKKYGKLTGHVRMRMRPEDRLIKLWIDDGDLEKAWQQYLGNVPGYLGNVPGYLGKVAGNPASGTPWTRFSHQDGFSDAPGFDGQDIPPIAGFKEAAKRVEAALGVPRIGGSTQKLESGLYRVIPVGELQKADISFLMGYNTDPKRQLARAMHPRLRMNRPHLRLNTQRHLRRLLNGGVTRQERWQLGAPGGFGKRAPLGETAPPAAPRLRGMAMIAVNRAIIKSNKDKGENHPPFAIYHGSRKAGDAHEVHIHGPSRLLYRPTKPMHNGARVWIEADRAHVHGLLQKKLAKAAMLGALAGAGIAASASPGVRGLIRGASHKLYQTSLKDMLRQHLRVFEGATPPPAIKAGARKAIRRIATGAAVGGGLGALARPHRTAAPLYQLAAEPEPTQP